MGGSVRAGVYVCVRVLGGVGNRGGGDSRGDGQTGGFERTGSEATDIISLFVYQEVPTADVPRSWCKVTHTQRIKTVHSQSRI